MFHQNEEILLSVIAVLSLLFFAAIIFIGSMMRAKKRRLKYFKEQEQLPSEFAQALLETYIEMHQQTLRNIGRELHDNFGQVASLIKINLNTLDVSNIEKAKEKVESTLDLTRQLITDIKSLSVTLANDELQENGLAKAIETEVERIKKMGQFTASYRIAGALPDIDKDKTIILYRMAQEVLNNMLKHSKAKQINVLLNIYENLFTLVFTDDGQGFIVEEKINNGGTGLRNLQYRAQLINVQLSIQSTLGNGTNITIALPL